MFARTPRLFLRPAWLEGAPELAEMLNDAAVSCKLARVPHPYTRADAEEVLSVERRPDEIALLIFRRTGAAMQMVGGIGLIAREAGIELRYWLGQDHWGQGYVLEVGRAVLELARHTLGLRRIVALHGLDNPHSGNVLRQLGFRATGHVRSVHSVARGTDVPCAIHELELTAHKTPFLESHFLAA